MAEQTRVQTGVPGLDDILAGGLPRHRMYLVQGDPGVGKTTLGLQFLLEGQRQGETGLYAALSETREELNAVARSHGWSLEGLHFHEMSTEAIGDDDNTLYVPDDVELGERMSALLAQVDRDKPSRIVLDSCTELRLLAQSPLRFRRQLLALKANLVQRRCTILLLDNPVNYGGDPLLQSLVHGVIAMDQLSPLYGSERRRLRVSKLREVQFRGGYHDFRIMHDGVEVFPRLVAAEHSQSFERVPVSSGIAGLDHLLGGGFDYGTSTLLLGPAGSTKSALATHYAVEAARTGRQAAMFVFDESLESLFARSTGIGIPLREQVDSGRITLRRVDPAELAPGEFAHLVRQEVEVHGARMIVIDSLNGYRQAMPEEQFLTLQLHELLSYLGQMGVATIMVMAQHGLLMTGEGAVDLSYLADNVILFRYFEAEGRVRRAISVVKKRSGRHENTIREIALGADGFQFGPPLEQFSGILTGTPRFRGAAREGRLLGGDG